MSLVKQIAIGVAATVMLLLFGIGSYYASKQIFPDPKTTTTKTTTTTTNSSVPTVADMKRLNPQSVSAKIEGENVIVSFETADKVGSLVYITPSKTEKIAQAMKDFNNGVAVAGKWFVVTSDSDSKATHLLTVPKTVLAKSGTTYFYIVVSYKKYWLPYGLTTDFTTGASDPYLINL